MLERLEVDGMPSAWTRCCCSIPSHKVIGREPKDRGDYFLEPGGRARHRGTAPLAPYVFASVSICDARLFRDSPEGPFSLLRLWNRAEEEGRLFGVVQ